MEKVISAIHIYPVKSCRGISVRDAELNVRGLKHDREYMIIDQGGNFLTQRELPRLALIQPMSERSGVLLTAPQMNEIVLPPVGARGKERTVRVWEDYCIAQDQGEEVALWLSDFLKVSCRLVSLSYGGIRLHESSTLQRKIQVSFQDAYPLLIISESSLEDLNRRLDEPVPMDRFRPNLVVGNAEPYEEDSWGRVTIGGITLQGVKPCQRCITVATNQETGGRTKEPLATLATYRHFGKGVFFGSNFIHLNYGIVRMGDKVSVDSFRVPS